MGFGTPAEITGSALERTGTVMQGSQVQVGSLAAGAKRGVGSQDEDGRSAGASILTPVEIHS